MDIPSLPTVPRVPVTREERAAFFGPPPVKKPRKVATEDETSEAGGFRHEVSVGDDEQGDPRKFLAAVMDDQSCPLRFRITAARALMVDRQNARDIARERAASVVQGKFGQGNSPRKAA